MARTGKLAAYWRRNKCFEVPTGSGINLGDDTYEDAQPRPPTCDACGSQVALHEDRGNWYCHTCWRELDDEPRRKLTRQEKEEGLADRGCDTLDEYEGKC